MRRLVLVAILSMSSIAACDRARDQPAGKAEVPTLSVAELAGQLPGQAIHPVDANGSKTRKDFGVIPGAILLSDYETYAAAELPTDRGATLVFYCANEQCSASHDAAAKAVTLGYRDVKVLPAGILGWAKSGQRVDRP